MPRMRSRPGERSRSGPDRARVYIPLSQVSPGWPPVEVEALWAAPVDRMAFRIDNSPFFAPNLAVGDVVSTTEVKQKLIFADRLSWGGNRTIRVRLREGADLDGGLEGVFDIMSPFGVEGEGDPLYRLASLCVPGSADLPPIINALKAGVEAGWWDYEEGCVDPAWADAVAAIDGA